MADAMLNGQLHIRPETLRDKHKRLVEEVTAQVDEYCQATGEEFSPAQRTALIRGQVQNRQMADWAEFEGRTYGYWAPLTPVVMIPFVALFGVGVSDQVINVLFGALNVGLFYWLLCRVDRIGLLPTNVACRTALTVLLAFGTSHFWLACTAQVWFAVHIVTLTAFLAVLIVACASGRSVRQHALSGVFFGAAILGRNIVVMTGLFFVVLMWIRSRETGRRRIRTFALRTVVFAVPIVVAVAIQGAYNHARFGSVYDS